ncbi:MAG TPA: hypothetical protein VFI52_18230 [Gemmatimonadaceae bacterium]|nr:hypothetical protein [Gemmatimonadaceae bacterium]
MLSWLIGAVVGALVTLWQYGRTASTRRLALPAALRAIATALVVALLLEAPAGTARAVVPDVAVDASESWLRAAPRCDRWRAALDSASALGAGRWQRFGDSVRTDQSTNAPADHASRLRPVVDRAAATGRPVVIITDGELDDGDAVDALPRGSRTIVMPCTPAPDAALSTIEVPRTLVAGDTLSGRVTVVAGAAGAAAGQVDIRLDSTRLALVPYLALTAFAEQTLEFRVVATGGDRAALLRASIHGDVEARNDTLSVGVDVSRAPAAVFVSTAPDYDAREAVAALRSVTSLPTRAYYRVAPGAWRMDGTLARVEESVVRAAVRDAPIVVLHGDTAAFGPPRTATRGALLLFAPPAASDGEWFAAAAPPSPIAATTGVLPFDSLPPLDVAPAMPRGEWQGLVVRRGGSSDDRRTALVGWDAPRRIAVLGASGLWRWRFRGGARADAYSAFFGSLYDWLAAGRSDRRAAVPDGAPMRAGAPIRWRRGAGADSVVAVTITRRSATGRVYTVTLRFLDGATVTESPALPPGVYDARMAGGSAVLAVNPSRELVPRRPSVATRRVGGAATLGDAPALRSLGWVYALVVLLLCAEWGLRRKAGVR